jgi:hypothetical protein
MQPLFLNTLGGLFSGVKTAFTGTSHARKADRVYVVACYTAGLAGRVTGTSVNDSPSGNASLAAALHSSIWLAVTSRMRRSNHGPDFASAMIGRAGSKAVMSMWEIGKTIARLIEGGGPWPGAHMNLTAISIALVDAFTSSSRM